MSSQSLSLGPPMPPPPGRVTVVVTPLTVKSTDCTSVALATDTRAEPDPLKLWKPAALSSSTLELKVQVTSLTVRVQVPTSTSLPPYSTVMGWVSLFCRLVKYSPRPIVKESPLLRLASTPLQSKLRRARS